MEQSGVTNSNNPKNVTPNFAVECLRNALAMLKSSCESLSRVHTCKSANCRSVEQIIKM